VGVDSNSKIIIIIIIIIIIKVGVQGKVKNKKE
jgi:hypothetical protein